MQELKTSVRLIPGDTVQVPSIPFENEVLRDCICNENRYRMLAQGNPEAAG